MKLRKVHSNRRLLVRYALGSGRVRKGERKRWRGGGRKRERAR